MKPAKLSMAKILSALLFAICLFDTARADEPRPLAPQDFASGVEITGTNTGAPLYRFDLPVDAFTGTAWPDLRDVRVFNSQGEAVPFWLLEPETRSVQDKSIALQLFLLPAKSESGKRGKLVVGAGQRQIEITLPENEGEDERPAATTYLLELKQEKARPRLARMQFKWQNAAANWQARVVILGSNNLHNWEPVASGTLADLKSGGENLRIDRIALPVDSNWHYWLLRFDTGTTPKIDGVSGSYAERPAEVEQVKLAMNARRISAAEYEYTLPHALPLSALRIELPTINAIARTELSVRTTPSEAWSLLGTNTLYRFNGNGGEQVQGDIDTANRTIQSLRIVAKGSAWGEGAPTVLALVGPRTVVFNARGNEPFILAWGARAADAVAMTSREQIPGLSEDKALDNIPIAFIDKPIKLGGPERLTAVDASERAAGWQKAALWGALVAGAAALVWLALKLLREASTKPSAPAQQ